MKKVKTVCNKIIKHSGEIIEIIGLRDNNPFTNNSTLTDCEEDLNKIIKILKKHKVKKFDIIL